MVPLTSTFGLIFLLAQKMTYPYLAHAKELPIASSCHPPSPQMAWYIPSLPQYPIMGIYTYIIFTNVSVWLLRTGTCCTQVLLEMRTNIQWYSTSTYTLQKRSAFILYHKVMNQFPRKPTMCIQCQMIWYLECAYIFKGEDGMVLLGASLM